MKNQKGFGVIETILILAIVGIVGGAGFYVYNANKRVDNRSQGISKTNSKKQPKEVKKEIPSIPDLIEYPASGVQILIKDDVSKLTNSSDSFKNFISGMVGDKPIYASGCEYPKTITVGKIYKDEFATGGQSSCGGTGIIWKKENGVWGKILSGQDTPYCSELAPHKVPKEIAPTCVDTSSGDDSEYKVISNPN